MDCSAEEGEIRRALDQVPGIRSLNFQLGARTLGIDADTEVIPAALSAIRKAGFKPEPLSGGTEDKDDHSLHSHGDGGGIPRMALALAFAVAAEAVSFFAPEGQAWKIAGMAVAGIAIWLAGLDVYKKGIAALLRGKLNINALMSVAVTGAFVIGQWPEAAMVMALYGIAELIEARAVDRARNAIKGLLDLAPDDATVLGANGQWQQRPVKEIALESVVRIKPGERVPLDGVVTKGTGAVNQAPVTGESIPVDKAPGDPLFAGTINETGELEFRVTAAASNTTLARIIAAVEQAQGTRAPTQRFVDRFAAIYTPAVFVIALGVAIGTPFFLGFTWMDAIYKALVLLVIACPCALVISTPVSVVSGLAAGARRGMLIKGGTYLETARLIKAVAIDKTGTVTEGKPKLVEWAPWGDADKAQVRLMAASLASRSDHPVSQAIAAGLGEPVEDVLEFGALAGRGVEATFGGQRLLLGNHRVVHERGLCSPELEALLRSHEHQGRTVTLLANGQRVLAFFAVADTIRASSRQAIQELKELGIAPVMLTGDNKATAQAIAMEAGITDARGDLLPEDKLQAIKEMQKQYGATAMAGDGINDAPALAQADIGFAMGGAGTDVAMESADIVIMNDNLRRVAETVRLSRRTHAILWQNIILALAIKFVFFVLAVFGSATMWMAVFADMGASLLVVANGLRLLRTSDLRTDEAPKPTATSTARSSHEGHDHAH
jgi:Cd2+/Zn2+-exporting ATPase